MRKFILSALVLALSLSAMAQDQVGVYVGGFNGVSYKHFLTSNLAIQTDLGVGMMLTAGNDVYYYRSTYGNSRVASKTKNDMRLLDFVLNPNLLYQFDIKGGFSCYAGGGVSLGLTDDWRDEHDDPAEDILGKWGVNALVGAEYKFSNVPLAIALDFRPGYGMMFTGIRSNNSGDIHMPMGMFANLFDWKLGLAVRYCF